MSRVRSEAGFTLIEVLVAILLLVLLLGLLMGPLVGSQRVANRDVNYAFAQQNARTGLDSMVSQIRQAIKIESAGANQVELDVNLQGTTYTVEYDCTVVQDATHHECLRAFAPQGQTPSFTNHPQVVVSNLLNGGSDSTPVFSWTPDALSPYYMTATVDVPASGNQYGGLKHTIVFTDGALMRNLQVGN